MHCLYSSTQGPAVDFESSQRDHLPVNTYMATMNETHRTQTVKNQLPKEGMLAVSQLCVPPLASFGWERGSGPGDQSQDKAVSIPFHRALP